MAFDQVELSDIHESFWQPAGMLCRCLPTGNSTAFYAIRQVGNSSSGHVSKFYQHCAVPLVASGYFSFTWLLGLLLKISSIAESGDIECFLSASQEGHVPWKAGIDIKFCVLTTFTPVTDLVFSLI